MVFKIQLSNFAYTANTTFNAGQNGAAAAALDPIGHSAYFGTFSGQIVKIDLRSFTEIASIAPNLGSIASAAIDPSGGFAYFGTSTTPGNIIRIRLSDFSVNRTLNLGRLGGASSMAIDAASGYGYFGTSGCGLGIFTPLPPHVIVKVKLSDLSINKTQQLTLPTTNCLSSADIDPAGGFAYFAGSGFSGSALVRIRLSDFSLAGVLSPGPDNTVNSLALDPARGLMYAGEGGPALLTIRLSDYNQIGSVYAYSQNGPIFNQRAAAQDLASGDAYFTASTVGTNFRTTGAIVRLVPAVLPSNDFSLSTSPSTVSFQEGSLGAAYVSVASNNYTGAINLAATVSSSYALNPTVTVLNPSIDLIRNGENSSIIAISAPIPDDIPISTFVVSLIGTSGGMVRQVSLYVTINLQSFPYEIYVQPESLGLHPGNGYDPSISIQTHIPTPFVGAINLTASITPLLPNGPEISVNPSSVIVPSNWVAGYTGISNVFITTNSSTTTGQYEVDVRATSQGVGQTAQFCLLIVPLGVAKFCILSDANSLSIGPGQSETSTITLYKTVPLVNNTYLGTVNFSISVVSGPSTNAISTTFNPAILNLPYVLPGPQKLHSSLTVTASPNALPGNYTIRISATNGTLTGFVDVPLIIETGPVAGIPGVFPGDWAEYQTFAAWTSTPAGLPAIPEVGQYLNAYGAILRVAATTGNESASLLSIGYLNGTQNDRSVSGNTIAESGTLFPWVVGSSLNFNTTVSQVFAGASRLASILNVTETNSGVTAIGVWTWDYQTGILLDYRLTVQGTGNLGTITGMVHVRILDTNLWTPTQPYFTVKPSTPFLTMEEFILTSSKVSVTSLNNFSGSVTLTAQPIPSNPNISLSINSTLRIQPDQTSNATLTISSGLGHFLILVNATSGSQFHLALLGVTAIPLAPPTVTINAGPNPANTGEPVTLNFTIQSAPTFLHVTIDWGDGTVTYPDPTLIFSPYSPWASLTHVYTTTEFSPSHTYVISVNVTSVGGQGLATVSETVNDRGPTLTITSLSPDPASTGHSAALNFATSDPDGIIQTTWVDWGDGSVPDLIFNMTSGSMCQRLNPDLQSSACTLALGDLLFSQPQDPSTIINGSIIIFRPYPATPFYLVAHRVIRIIPASDSSYSQITFWTRGDANPVMDAWDQANGGIPASQVVAVYQYIITPPGSPTERYDTHTYSSVVDSQSKTFTIRVNATDDSGLTISQTTSETIIDRPPVLTLNKPTPSPATISQSVTVSFSATDPDGTVSSFTVNWGDGSSPDTLSASATSDTHSYDRAGSFTISVTATDDSGSSTQVSNMSFIVTSPSAPASPAPTILGLAPVEFYLLIGIIAAVIAATSFLLFTRVRNKEYRAHSL